MDRPRLPLGDYVQLLSQRGLLRPGAGAGLPLTRPVPLVSCDSKLVVPDALFICKGAAFKPEYLAQAAQRGALAYVSETVYPQIPLPCLRVTEIREAMALLADRAWGHPSGRLRIAAVTGTKGKTTTAYYIKSILDERRRALGERETAILSTIVTDDGVERRPARLTTPEPLDLQRHLWNAASSGAGYLTMEVSSQALKYHRVTGCKFSTGIFLNIGQDHISPREHPDFEDYFSSKLKLFSLCETAVVNLDGDFSARVLDAARVCPRLLTCSLKDPGADVFASNLRKEGNATLFRARTPSWEGDLRLNMPGLFNVENALAAVAAAESFGVGGDAVAAGLARALVPGRMETCHSADGRVTVIVDYAHNGMSLEALLSSVRREYPDRELTVLFGCTGGKGLDRREGMGKAAGRWADRILLTEDDPGPEAVEDICREIGAHIAPFGKAFAVVPDREEAISRAVLEAREPAVVVLAGKGAEQEQKRKNGPVPCAPDGMLARKVLARHDGR